ncbi:MAG TPA: competence/damage-inducible protein A [Polyangiaceae bacterium]|nr:competence/damage-inducible protein A [Polyangiaceae bacterium]
MTAAVFCIGTELTRGEIANTNATWLCEELTLVGHEVTEVAVVPDDRANIQSALARLAATHSVIVSTGGLGPTTDDITSECVAAVLGVPLERDAASLEAVRARMARFGRALTDSNAKQADFPRGATVLPNPNGTAPGFVVNIGRCRLFVMPGVPNEMKPMFANHVAPDLRTLVSGGSYQVRLRTFGMPESAVNDRLAGIEAAHHVVIGYRAHFPEIEVKVLARAPTQQEAKRVAIAAAEAAKSRLGDVVYGEGSVDFAESVGSLFRERGLTLAAAESCTGGLVAQLITDHPGASEFFRGSIVAYDDSVKTAVLGVPTTLVASRGAVSTEVTRAMAEGARRALGVDVALAVTGLAGPGGTPSKAVGDVHLAVATADGTTDRQLSFPSARSQVRLLAAYAGLSLVRRVVLHGHGGDQ